MLAITFKVLSAITGVLSWGEKGIAASKETRNLMKKEIKGVICIYLLEQSSEALLLIRRFELHVLEYWEAGGSLQTCFKASIFMVMELSIASQFISKLSYFSFITWNLTLRRENDQLLAGACFSEQT